MRYLNSFFITSIIYLIVTFFLFFIFADTLIEEKKPEEIKISLKHMMTQQEPTPVAPLSEPTPIEPNTQKKIDKPKKEKKLEQKQQEHKKIAKEPISEKIEESIPTLQTEQKIPTTEKPIKQTDTAQEQNIEAEYLAKVKSLIEQNKDYPKTAKRLNQSGKVYVKFVITKDGEIKNCIIEKSSQFESLDKASLEILIKIASFEAIPKELNRSYWEITVPISYQIN
jgi:protein TonB